MISRALYLIFTALALFAVASAQQRPQAPTSSGTVNIQPSGGGGAVIVSVAKSRVRVGELVSFTLTPAKIVTNPKYKVTVDFGDGNRAETRQVVVTHRYQSTGHYTVRASVVPPPFENGPDRLDPQGPIPSVTLDASPSSADANTPVTFSARLSSSFPGIKYRFAFGDGSQTDWLDSSNTRHSYAAPGTYLAYVDLGLNSGGRVRQVGGSLRQSIVVNQQRPDDPIIKDPKAPNDPKTPDRLPGPVSLTAGPSPVQQGKPVSFAARADATNSNVRYRFVFGDGSSRGWQANDNVSHEYSSKGNYSATVTLGLLSNGKIKTLSSDKQRIQVTDSAPATAVEFQVNPSSASMGQAVGFNARVTPAESDLRYRFIYGDGPPQTEWQTASQASYAYKAAGAYTAHVEIGRWTNGRVVPLATSNTKVVSVSEGAVSSVSPGPSPSVSGGGGTGGGGSSPGGAGTTASPSVPGEGGPGGGLPNNWWLYLLIALLLIFAAYQAYKSLLAPRTTFHASRDPGNAEVDSAAKGLEINSQVLLHPNVADAQYLVHSDEAFVRSVRRENV